MQDIYSIHIRGVDGTVQDIEFGASSLPDIVTQTANNVIAFSSAGISITSSLILNSFFFILAGDMLVKSFVIVSNHHYYLEYSRDGDLLKVYMQLAEEFVQISPGNFCANCAILLSCIY